MTTLALDSATTTGVAVVRGAELLHVSVHKVKTFADVHALLTSLRVYGIDRIVVEKTFSDPGKSKEAKGKRNGGAAQNQVIGVWKQACREVFPKVRIEELRAVTWRSMINMPERNTANSDRLKVISLAMAAKRWPSFDWTSDDASDAALLGLAMETRPR
jgi:hypothetical protein